MRRLYSVILFITLSIGLQAQFRGLEFGKVDGDPDVDTLSFKKRLVYGGSGGGAFQNGITFLNLSPTVGYRLTNTITAGINLNTIYQSDSYTNVRFYLLGPAAYVRKRIFNYFFVQSEAELLYTRRILNYKSVDPIVDNRLLPGILLGGGIVTGPAQGPLTTISVMYNVIYNETLSLIKNPQFRIGFSIGF